MPFETHSEDIAEILAEIVDGKCSHYLTGKGDDLVERIHYLGTHLVTPIVRSKGLDNLDEITLGKGCKTLISLEPYNKDSELLVYSRNNVCFDYLTNILFGRGFGFLAKLFIYSGAEKLSDNTFSESCKSLASFHDTVLATCINFLITHVLNIVIIMFVKHILSLFLIVKV